MNGHQRTRFLMLFLLFAVAFAARAQNYPSAEQTPELTTSEFEEWIAAIPGDNTDVRDALRGIHAMYLEQHEAGFQRFIGAYNATSAMEDKAAARRDLYLAWYVERDTLRHQLLDDLRIVLDESSRFHIDRLDRYLRRKRVESLYINVIYTRLPTSHELFDDARRARLSPNDRKVADDILERFEMERDTLNRRVEMELRQIAFSRFIERTSEAERAQFREALLKASSYRPLFIEPLEQTRKRILQALTPEGKIAWRIAVLERRDPQVFVQSPVDVVRAAMVEADTPVPGDVLERVDEVIARFSPHRDALRMKILEQDEVWVDSGKEEAARKERTELIERIQKERDPTINPDIPLLRDPRLPFANALLALELETLRELDAIVPAAVQRTLSNEARLLLRWGRHAPER